MKILIVSSEGELYDEGSLIKGLLQESDMLFHLRKPDWSEEQLRRMLDELTPGELSQIIIHDHYHLADIYSVAGIHLSEKKRKDFIRGSLKVSGTKVSSSFHSVEDILKEKHAFAYGFCGPLFDSISKPGYLGKTSDLRFDHAKPFPVYAIGGISAGNAKIAEEYGYDGVALSGYIWNSADPVSSLKQVLNALSLEV